MMKYPIGIQSFETIRKDGYVYVDKTDLVYKLAQGHIDVLAEAHRQTGQRCVVLVDEYDKPMLDVLDSDLMTTLNGQPISVEEDNRQELKAFYSCFKAADQDLRFVLLTGVTKFSQVSVFSGFNQPSDLTLDVRYETPYSMRPKKDQKDRELYFHYTFYLLMRLISCYTVYTEKQLSEGRADCIVETPKYIYIFEFKLDGTADEALSQINERGYGKPYEADSRQVFLVGASFSSKTGTVEEWKYIEQR